MHKLLFFNILLYFIFGYIFPSSYSILSLSFFVKDRIKSEQESRMRRTLEDIERSARIVGIIYISLGFVKLSKTIASIEVGIVCWTFIQIVKHVNKTKI